jgi:hypothetical protein
LAAVDQASEFSSVTAAQVSFVQDHLRKITNFGQIFLFPSIFLYLIKNIILTNPCTFWMNISENPC